MLGRRRGSGVLFDDEEEEAVLTGKGASNGSVVFPAIIGGFADIVAEPDSSPASLSSIVIKLKPPPPTSTVGEEVVITTGCFSVKH